MRWPGFTDDNTLLLPVRDAPSRPLSLDGVAFEPKHERHVTLVGRALGARLAESIAQGRLAEADLEHAFEALDWSYDETGGYVWLAKDKDDGVRAESVVELVSMPAMTAFHFAIGRRLGAPLAPPPPHVTRWVRGDREGIGVPDEETLAALTVRLVAAEELAHAR